MKKLILSCFALCLAVLCLVLLPQETQAAEPTIIASGECGENLTWTLYEDGELIIAGNGYLYSGDSPWAAYKEAVTFVTIESGVKNICADAFREHTNLVGVQIPDTVTQIGMYAFYGCSKLAGITIPNSVYTIGDAAFHSCATLTNVTIPASVTEIGNRAFGSCVNLTGIWVDENNPKYSNDPSGVLFSKNKTSLIQAPATLAGTYIVPNSVTSIGNWAFSGCIHLEEVIFYDGITHIGQSAFFDCDKIKSITLPNSVVVLNPNAFYSCDGLERVMISKRITHISSNAFAYCEGLSDIYFRGNAPGFDANVFTNVTATAHYPSNNTTWTAALLQNYGGNITWVDRKVLNSGTCGTNAAWTLYEDGEMVISGSGPMTDYSHDYGGNEVPWLDNRLDIICLTIDPGITSIGNYAFQNCYNLVAASIPADVTRIGEYAFDGCVELTLVTLPNNLTYIGISAFSACYKLILLKLPDNLITIESSAFAYCDNIFISTIPNKVTTIGPSAFCDSSLSIITIPAGVVSIGTAAFQTDSLMGIWVDPNNPNYSNDAHGFLFDKDKTILLQAPGAATGTYTVPEGVQIIAARSFASCSTLNSVILSDSVEIIESRAFYFSGIKSLSLGNGLATICTSAFEGTDITTITIPSSVTSIDVTAFDQCFDLTGIWVAEGNPNYSNDHHGVLFNKDKTALLKAPGAISYSYIVPDSVRTIGEYAFYRVSIDYIVIPNSVTEIGRSAFAWCYFLGGILLSDGVPEIDENAFLGAYATFYYPAHHPAWTQYLAQDFGGDISWQAWEADESGAYYVEQDNAIKIIGCDDARSKLVLPEAIDDKPVTVIGDYAFCTYEDLEYVVIPKTVTHVGNSIFPHDTGSKSLFFCGDAPVFSPFVFYRIPLTVYYPANNDTWTDHVGTWSNVTWIAVENEEHAVTWVQATTSLEGNIGLNFYVKLSDSLVNDPTTAMRFVFNGVTIEVPLSQAVKSGDQYKFTCPVSAKNMADTVNAQIITADGSVGEARNLAVMTYCNYMIQYSNSAKLVNLMKAMLNYGAAAQILFDHNTDNLANASLSEADKVLADVDASAYAHSVTGSEAGIQVYNATLLLETETTARIYFKLTGSKTIDQYTFKVDGVVVQPKPNGNLYYVEIPNIAAQHLDEMHTVTVGGITIRYGGLSYVNQVIKNPAYATEAMTNAAKALFAYNKMAENYFN